MAEEFDVDYIVEGPDPDGLFLIKWKGYDESENTWEPRENLPDDLVAEYFSEKEGENGSADKRGRVQEQGSKDVVSTDRRIRKKQKGIPGVSVAAPVRRDEEGGVEPKTIPKFFKGHGVQCVVTVLGKFLYPKEQLRELHRLTYCRTSFTMVIVDIGRRKIADERAYVFLLEPAERHDGELHGTFYCRFAHARVLKAAAPNQLFKPSDLIDQRAILEVHDGLSDDSSADESDHDPEQDGGLGADDVPTWDKDANGNLKFNGTSRIATEALRILIARSMDLQSLVLGLRNFAVRRHF